MQLYVNKDHAITERIVRHAEERGVKGELHSSPERAANIADFGLTYAGLFITVDAPQLGRREKDMRQKFADEGSNVQQGSNVDKSQGAARAISSFIDPGLCWKVSLLCSRGAGLRARN
jgi:L-lactate dehydrogenase (cytochrome)